MSIPDIVQAAFSAMTPIVLGTCLFVFLTARMASIAFIAFLQSIHFLD